MTKIIKNRLNNIILCLFSFIACQLYGQEYNLGTPILNNFSKQEYHGGIQSWDADYGLNGHVFFANNDGLLCYDGASWELFPLPKKTIARSVAIGTKNRVYVGGQDEIGYFHANKNGKLIYHSIKDKIPEQDKALEDIWNIEVVGEDVYFRSLNKIFHYKNDTIKTFKTGYAITELGQFQGQIYFADMEKGLYRITNGALEHVPNSSFLKNTPIAKLISLDDKNLLICSERKGIFQFDGTNFEPWSEANQTFFQENRIQSAININKNQIAIGTLLKGVIILNEGGRAIYKISKGNGLQNNSVLAMSVDNSGNLWMGTNNGIDQLKLGTPISKIIPDGNLEGSVYDVAFWNDHIYFGTSNGLYHMPWQTYYNPFKKEDFKLIPNTAGQVWGLDVIDDQLFLGHNDGAFQITSNHQAIQLGNQDGAWKFIKLNEDYFISGNYSGINLYKRNENRWQHVKQYENFEESSRIMMIDKHKNLWVTHPYRGIFKLNFSEDLMSIDIEKMGADQGVDSTLTNFVFNVNDHAYLTNELNILAYDYNKKSFDSNNQIAKSFDKNANIKRLIEDNFQNIYYISPEETGELLISNSKGLTTELKKIVYPELSKVFVGGFENLVPYGKEHIFVCTEKGALHFDKQQSKYKYDLVANIKSMYLIKPVDSLVYGGFSDIQTVPELKANENAVRFTFTTNNFEDPEATRYSFKLDGLDKEWSTWQAANDKEYTNLNNGDYTFLLKANDGFGNESQVIEYNFHIQAPWYKSTLAYLLYFLLAAAIVLALILLPRRKYKEETAQLIEQRREKEAELERLKTEKLQSEIDFKNKELASSTMHLLQKNSTLNRLREDIEKIQPQLQSDDAKKEVRKILNILKDDERLEEDWEKFSYHFDQVHSNFIKRLKKGYPNLTPKDQKLCAYLRMNLTSKEIAPLLNISVRGVEISRYRLRKKLRLEKEENLSEFMMSY